MKDKIIVELQKGIPFIKNPFEKIAEEIGISTSYCLQLVKELEENKIIRHISPIYDTKMLGYSSSLVAFMVPDKNIDSTVALINSHPGVSHNYLRNNDFNVWFTLALPPDTKSTLSDTLAYIAQQSGVTKFAVLDSTKVFKIGVKLNKNASSLEKEKIVTKETKKIPLTKNEIKIISLTQGNMPINKTPFKEYSEKLNITENELLDKLKEFKERGVMRRFAAILNHRNAGFKANGMGIWKIPKDKTIEVGNHMATYKAISHCYERTVNQYWDYNIFSMIHGESKEKVEVVVDQLKKDLKEKEITFSSDLLYSITEFKKKRLTYFSNDYYQWEATHLSC